MADKIKWYFGHNGNIHLNLVSNGRSGPEWIAYLESKGYRLSIWTKQILEKSTAPTEGVMYRIVIRPVKKIPLGQRTICWALHSAQTLDWKRPHWEVAPLIRDTFTDEEIQGMGLGCVSIMHIPALIEFDPVPTKFEPEPVKSTHLATLAVHALGAGKALYASVESLDLMNHETTGFCFQV